MKKIILIGFLLVSLVGVAIGGIYYANKKAEIAQLEKAGLEFLKGLEEENTSPDQEDQADPKPNPTEPNPLPEEKAKASEEQRGQQQNTTQENSKQENTNQENTKQNNTPQNNSQQKTDQQLADEMGSGVSTADKIKAITIVTSKVPGSQLNYLRKLASGGLTAAETSEAKAILKTYLSKEDIAALRELANKYTK